MKLRHATLRKNLPGITRAGLLCSKSKGARPVVWLHAPAASGWAALHTVRRHHSRIEGVVILEADVPRSWLKRSGKGYWFVDRDVPPERLRRLFTFANLASHALA